jgi:hypothetical protein
MPAHCRCLVRIRWDGLGRVPTDSAAYLPLGIALLSLRRPSVVPSGPSWLRLPTPTFARFPRRPMRRLRPSGGVDGAADDGISNGSARQTASEPSAVAGSLMSNVSTRNNACVEGEPAG